MNGKAAAENILISHTEKRKKSQRSGGVKNVKY